MMFEKQCKSGTEKLSTNSSNPDDPTTQSSILAPADELSEKDQEEARNGAAGGKGAVKDSREICEEEKTADPDQSNDGEAKAISGSQSPSRKRPRSEDTETTPGGLA